ncbi:MAG: thioredoxin family protein [Planctomycetaceae bacterium]|nr:thioredoxin family protein [Planctomycetaceae bacterium]MBV8384414.1 thioredoxin family protein [Planctomycetaceae bacterium]MBV8555515.1 thioredoxin family protein [Planctomycetaceae bacterium]MBV8610818.1 thioredoxin family protein [Singulisphaera sp.]MBV8677973.1 thioredoxin family protein [Planctomycetaceae bacterium]
MVLTPSTMLSLGSKAPDFRLPDTDGRTVSLDDFKDAPALLVIFLCNHCPYVKHVRHELAALAREYRDRGVAIVGISANDAAVYPDDSPEQMAREKAEVGYVFPYLYDESQEVAKAYQAACTPDFFVFDRNRSLVYRGQMDDSRPSNGRPVTGRDLRAALDAVLAGTPIPEDQKPSMGCNIKWKPGNAPSYFG